MRILVIRFSALGDVAMTVPVILEVLKQNPNLEIDVLTRSFTSKLFPVHDRLRVIPADVDRQYKGVLGLWSLSRFIKKQSKYTAVADLHSVMRSKVITTFLGIKSCHLDKGRKEKKALTRKKDKARGALRHTAERYADVFRALGVHVELSHQLNPISSGSKIGFAPFAQHKGKAWTTGHIRSLLEKMSNDGMEVVLYGNKNEYDRLSVLCAGLSGVSIYKGNDIASDIESMKSLKLMISMDSANMHLASLVGVPVISIWGATHTDAGFLGYGQSLKNAVQISTKKLECRPCSVYGNVPCHRGDWACMELLSSSDVFQKIKEVVRNQTS